MTEREAFEAWISAPPFEKSIDRCGPETAWPGNYRKYETELAWEAWQESRRVALTEAMKACQTQKIEPGLAGEDSEPAYNVACCHCSEAILALRDAEAGERG